jgi:hypothetical protein
MLKKYKLTLILPPGTYFTHLKVFTNEFTSAFTQELRKCRHNISNLLKALALGLQLLPVPVK